MPMSGIAGSYGNYRARDFLREKRNLRMDKRMAFKHGGGEGLC